MTFKAASDTDPATKTKEGIEKVIPCQASAGHGEIEGSTSRTVQKGKTECIMICAKDRNGENLTTGGDVISTRCSATKAAENTPSTTITDNDNGSYTIACTCPAAGTFQLEVYVNGEKMATNVTITCVAFSSAFDPNECHPSTTISADRQKASLNQGGWVGHLSVLGSTPMRHGHHTWKIRIGRDRNDHMFGIAPKLLSAQRKNDYDTVAYCWYSSDSDAWYQDGVQVTGSLSVASGNDTFQFDFDCDRHTLRATNLRSGESSTFSNLPNKEYFQFANLYQNGNSVEFVD